MRKNIFFFAALAAFGFVAQSCTNDDVQNGNEAPQAAQYIRFSNPLMDGMNATRAASTTAAVMNVADEEMDVIGYYANDVATAAQQGIQYVGVSDAPITLKYGTAWDYKNSADMSFWPGGDICFQAVYPSTHTGVTVNPTAVAEKTPQLNRNVTIQSDAANQIDLVFGDAVANSGTVGLVFKHGLSKIDFNAQMLTSTMSARIKDVKIHNVHAQANVGFLGAVSGQKRDLSVSGYTALAAANSFDAGITEKAVAAYDADDNPLTDLMAAGGSLILMPQTTDLMTADSKALIPAWSPAETTGTIEIANTAGTLATYFELDVYLDTQDGTILLGSMDASDPQNIEYTYAKVYIPFQANWAQGTKYTYTFQIGAGTGGYKADGTPIFAPISYTVSSVTDWTDGGNTNKSF